MGQGLHGEAEDRLAVHVDVGGIGGVGARDVQGLLIAPAAQHGVKGGVIRPPLHHRGPGPVPEEDAGGPVGKVDDAAEGLHPHDEGVLPAGSGQQAFGGVQSVDEAGAGGVQVEAHRVLRQAQIPLEDAGGGGGEKVLGQSGHDAHPDLLRSNAGALQSLFGGGQTEGGVAFHAGAVVAAGDTGAGDDPLVVGVHNLGHVVVGDGLTGQGGAGAQQFDAVHGRSFLRALLPIWRNFL